MQYLKYPLKVMNITQTYNGSGHKIASTGNPASYPIDDICEAINTRSNFYAPCDVVVRRVYGVGNGGTNSIWLESKEKVKLANGKESYVTILVIHPNDDTLKRYKKGQTFKQGDKMFLEGNDGQASGFHFHIEVSTSRFSELGNGWIKNNKGGWVISKSGIKPEEAFFIDPDFTAVKNSKGLKFNNIPKDQSSYPKSSYKGASLVEALIQLKIDHSFSSRSKIALANGISGYRGTASQNTKLLNLLKEGKLKKFNASERY